MTSRLLTTTDVANATGATVRQLHAWDRCGYATAAQRAGNQRLYGEGSLERIRRLVQLSAAGVAVGRAVGFVDLEYSSVLRLTVPTVIGDVLVVPA